MESQTFVVTAMETDVAEIPDKACKVCVVISCIKRLTLPWRGYESTVALNVQRSWEGGIERDRARVNALGLEPMRVVYLLQASAALATVVSIFQLKRKKDTQRVNAVVESRTSEGVKSGRELTGMPDIRLRRCVDIVLSILKPVRVSNTSQLCPAVPGQHARERRSEAEITSQIHAAYRVFNTYRRGNWRSRDPVRDLFRGQGHQPPLAACVSGPHVMSMKSSAKAYVRMTKTKLTVHKKMKSLKNLKLTPLSLSARVNENSAYF
ncbi:hypothetical protein EVAR_73318_1 [Eumeta japonica]|uniref:Uncharacterized protein n=1 Tax=Eumeta variegata TaxID=151549 RepID=A0A4C1SIF7_EUMVA|nr:hypothetical protein EVAR_73318_1 [Eumeta japonica]